MFPNWRRNAFLVPIIAFLASLAFTMTLPFVPLIVRDLGVRDQLEIWTGTIMLVFYIIGFVTNPIWGGLADHYGPKLMVLRATFGMGICMLLVAFSTSPLMFAGLFMLVGVFNGSNPALNALVVATMPKQRIGTALTLNQSGQVIARILGPGLAAVLAGVLSQLHWMYWISGSSLIIAGMVALFVQDVKQRVVGQWRLDWVGDLRALLDVPRMTVLLLLCFVSSALWNGNVTVISILTLQLFAASPPEFGSEAAWISATAIGLALSSLIALPFWGRMLDKGHAERVLIYTMIGAILTHLPMLFLQTPLSLVVARVAFGLAAIGMLPAIVHLLKDYAPAGMDARAISYGTSFQFIAMGLAPFVAGLIGPAFGLRAYIALTIVLTIASLGLWMMSGRRSSQQSKSD